ncbi:Alpha-1,3-mannosyltransferase-like protein [Elasticomyces elasticus]|uniref:Alpha-1,3/1,6-mannosyltransferase ALG2 n=1 Tax=Exophiala sideris TaxID=1016849 RepID=A0ABR0JG79_9EURO|nr:Alpha-1,3-mannosyltransferase-like protein [Elasticomyces elasticus]KAK5033176.1 Alpha-1,3-mannosyltransferase-like protein [Exophiala sideris]KAK5042324.1 Alpha-1,3-mannosyltransferase-like protein [Exophiala sideris]KAK5063720.1 Alpha-1,3-mannosyltransferase-like protein [Exophiala sideris]KAK5185591.1 Alpha-1,3-mannosyltransferase-like protein [Eurotiomycetes sp. CCFEE 6388]
MSKNTHPNPSSKRSIVFFHPDLGIGGAERLIVDAAVGLQEQGNKVTIFTSHCDPKHCFDEARDVSIWTNELDKLKPDVFIVDQLSACVPLLRWLYSNRQRTLFYCHFPDQLLADRRASGILGLAKKVYRFPFDWFEGWSMSASDRIVVNSTFTKLVASRVWPGLAESLGVIYPCVNVEEKETEADGGPLWAGQYKLLLSINRFERKKDIGLAIRGYQRLSSNERRGTRLVLAGGYDQRVSENVRYHKELDDLAQSLGLSTATAKTVPTALAIPSDIEVLFLLSVPGPFKNTLLRNAQLLLYTPSNEHFGIVPVEAMLYGVPVLASNTGGPLETIVEGKTGWLRDVDNVDEWAAVMKRVLHELSPAELQKLGQNGRQRVNERFTRNKMSDGLSSEIDQMVKNKRSTFLERKDIILALWLVLAVLAALFATIIKARFGRGDTRATEFARVQRANAGSEENLVRLFPGAA